MNRIEKGIGYRGVFSDFRRDVSIKSFTNGIVAAIFTYGFLLFFWALLIGDLVYIFYENGLKKDPVGAHR